MSTIKINEQIAFLRKQKGVTQEELAQALGVTNQSVSKWEAASCCPDIQLLPDIATYFGVTVDELLGYKPADTFANVYLKIKSLFEASPKDEAFTMAFRLCILLHEVACTKGYKDYVPWDTNKNYGLEPEVYKWGFSACSVPDGNTVHSGNAIFISDGKYAKPATPSQIREVHAALESLCDKNVLKVLFILYDMTCKDFDLYVPLSSIAEKCKLPEAEVEAALDNLPTTIMDTADGQALYRIGGIYMLMPSLLLMMPSLLLMMREK